MSSTSAHIGYAAPLEQLAPGDVVELAAAAEQAGFRGVMAADRFQPWVPKQGQAAFVWPVLGALGLGAALVAFGEWLRRRQTADSATAFLPATFVRRVP